MEKLGRSLTYLIGTVDYWRPSWIKLQPGSFFSLEMRPEKRLMQSDPKFPVDISSRLKWYRTNFKKGFFSKTFIMYYVLILILIFSVIYLELEIIFPFFSILSDSFFGMVSQVGSLTLLVTAATLLFSVNEKNRIGRIHENDLKKLAQEIIDYSREYFKENNIDPKKFPIKLAYNDYKGLDYEKKGKLYTAYLQL